MGGVEGVPRKYSDCWILIMLGPTTNQFRTSARRSLQMREVEDVLRERYDCGHVNQPRRENPSGEPLVLKPQAAYK